MKMYRMGVEPLCINLPVIGYAFNVSKSDGSGLLHHFAQFPGEFQFPLSRVTH